MRKRKIKSEQVTPPTPARQNAENKKFREWERGKVLQAMADALIAMCACS